MSDEERQALRRRVLDLVVQGVSPAAKGVGLPGLAAQRARGRLPGAGHTNEHEY